VDSVLRELQRLDRQMAQRSDPVGWLADHVPLAPATVGFMAGLAAAAWRSWTVWAWMVAAVFLAAGPPMAATIRARQAPHRTSIGRLMGLVAVAFACAGALRLGVFLKPGRYDLGSSLGSEPILATLRGVVLSEPFQPDRDQWLFGRYSWSGGGCSFYMKTTAARTPDGFRRVDGLVRVQVNAPAESLAVEPGDRVQLYCRLARFQPPPNRGIFDTAALMRRRGIRAAATVPAADGVIVLEKAPSASWRRWRTHLARLARAGLIDDRIGDDESRAIVEALLLGRRGGSPDVFEAFRRTGLAHFLCLSGLHFGILVGFVWGLTRTAGLGKTGRAMVCLAVTVAYILVIPPRSATLRAAVLCWFFCMGALVGRRSRPLNTLALTALLMLAIRPMDLFAADWQLSYGTVAGILLFYGPIRDRLGYASPSRPLHSRLPSWMAGATRFLDAAAEWIRDLLAVGLAAWLGGAGILLYHFGTITPLSALLTVLVYPLVLGILTFGFLPILVGGLFPTPGTLATSAATALAGLMIAIVRGLQHLPGVQITIGHTPGWIVALYYAVLLAWRFGHVFRLAPLPRMPRFVPLAGLAVLGAGLPMYAHRRRPAGLEMTVLSVGHGQAIHLALPDGRHWLIDAGSLTLQDPGRRIVAPYLRHRGVAALDAVVISHDDIDHLNGIPEIAATIPVRAVLTSEAVLARRATFSSGGMLIRHLEDCGIALRSMPTDPVVAGPVRIERIWPDPAVCEDPTVDDNDKSLVLRISCGNRAVLVCGDIETFAQQRLIESPDRIRADVLIMPHHGSQTHLDERFVRAVGSSVVVVSCGRTRQASAYHPPASTIAFYTPTDGAITIRIDPSGSWTVRGHLSGRTYTAPGTGPPSAHKKPRPSPGLDAMIIHHPNRNAL